MELRRINERRRRHLVLSFIVPSTTILNSSGQILLRRASVLSRLPPSTTCCRTILSSSCMPVCKFLSTHSHSYCHGIGLTKNLFNLLCPLASDGSKELMPVEPAVALGVDFSDHVFETRFTAHRIHIISQDLSQILLRHVAGFVDVKTLECIPDTFLVLMKPLA